MSNFISIRFLGVLLILGLGAAVMFGVYNQLIEIRADKSGCLGGKKWHQVVDKQQWASVGSVHFFYVPMTYSCLPDHDYDTSKYEVVNGIIQGRDQ